MSRLAVLFQQRFIGHGNKLREELWAITLLSVEIAHPCDETVNPESYISTALAVFHSNDQDIFQKGSVQTLVLFAAVFLSQCEGFIHTFG